MSSPRRDRRSRSASSSSGDHGGKPKRALDLVSTRNITPPRQHFHPRGRGQGWGRGARRPFIHRGHRGMTIFRGTSQRYYPRSRHAGHDTRRRSRSREYHRRSRSRSSSSGSGPKYKRHRSGSHERRHSKDEKHALDRDSPSPDRSHKKKSRRQSPERRQSHRSRSRSHSFEKPPPRGRSSPPVFQNKPDPGHAFKYREKHRHAAPEEEEARFGASRREHPRAALSPTNFPRAKKLPSGGGGASAVPTPTPTTATKGKDLIPKNRLHKIFTLISQDGGFELDEDISIAIQRNPYAEPLEDSTVTVVFDQELFSMIYANEGRKHRPIFEREEIKMFGHDKNLADDPDFERRVIRLKPGKSSHQSEESHSSSYQYRSSLEITRTVKRDRSRSSSSSRSSESRRHREPKFRLRVSTDPRFEARFAEVRSKEGAGPPGARSNLDPTDLRHELSSHRKQPTDARDRMPRERHEREDRRKLSDSRDPRDDQHKGREREREREELPDFSNRKDKNMDTPWLYDPEAIPKNPKYFMHDDREGDNRGRGRGRFFRGRFNQMRRPFRSRGNFRGGPYHGGRGGHFGGGGGNSFGGGPDDRSRSPRRNFSAPRRDYYKSPDREWKHDKFSELEHEGDKGKSSKREGSQEYSHGTSDR